MLLTNYFSRDQLIQPIFINDSLDDSKEIDGLNDNKVYSYKNVIRKIESDLKKGCKNFIIFFVPKNKSDSDFSSIFQNQILNKIKKEFGETINIWVDLCICSMTKTGHCCIFENKKIDFKKSLEIMSKLALSYAQGGADGIAPSSMLIGVVRAVREILDDNNFKLIPIMSYSTKFASNFYGPFRIAANSSPVFGDRKSYQLDYKSKEIAIESSVKFSKEGADLLMVKPGILSLDLINPIHKITKKPVGAYQVSGEYSSLVKLSESKLIDFDSGLLETWSSMKRAGANYIISYGAREAKRLGIDR